MTLCYIYMSCVCVSSSFLVHVHVLLPLKKHTRLVIIIVEHSTSKLKVMHTLSLLRPEPVMVCRGLKDVFSQIPLAESTPYQLP